MRVEPAHVEALTIYEADRLDPVFVVLQDFGGGRGRLVVECWGNAWSTYWGAMGSETLRQFIVGCDVDYIANRMWPSKQPRRVKADFAYLVRIVTAVQNALRTSVIGSESHVD